MHKRFIILFLAGVLLLLPAHSRASIIGYWTFDNGVPGNSAGTVVSDVNSPTLDGTATGYIGGNAPIYSPLVPGSPVVAGGSTTNPSNSGSLKFDNTGGPGGTVDPNSGTGGIVLINDPGGAGSVLKPASFTIEAFVRIEDSVNFSTLISKNIGASNSTWMMDTTNTGRLRLRFDTVAQNNQSASGAVIDDGLWHHVALTYDGSTGSARLFVDYADVGGRMINGTLNYNDNPLSIGARGGGRAFDGWIDEVRLSDTVLTSSQMLYAIPEPSTALTLLLVGGASFMRRKRRHVVPAG